MASLIEELYQNQATTILVEKIVAIDNFNNNGMFYRINVDIAEDILNQGGADGYSTVDNKAISFITLFLSKEEMNHHFAGEDIRFVFDKKVLELLAKKGSLLVEFETNKKSITAPLILSGNRPIQYTPQNNQQQLNNKVSKTESDDNNSKVKEKNEGFMEY